MRWKERDYLCYVWKCQSYSFCVSQEIPLWILKKTEFRSWNWKLPFARGSNKLSKVHQRTSIVSIFMRLYLCKKMGNSGTSFSALVRAWSILLWANIKVTALVWAKKISPEYWNNRISLMSLNTWCNIHSFITPRKGGILRQVIAR